MEMHEDMYKNMVDDGHDPFLSTSPFPLNFDGHHFSPLFGHNNLSPLHLPLHSYSLDTLTNSPQCNSNNMQLDPFRLTDENDCFYNKNIPISNLQYNSLEQDDESRSTSCTISASMHPLNYSHSSSPNVQSQSGGYQSRVHDVHPNPNAISELSDLSQNIPLLPINILNNTSNINTNNIVPPVPTNIQNNSTHYTPAPPIITNTTNTTNIQQILSLPELPVIPQFYAKSNHNNTNDKYSPILSLPGNPNKEYTDSNDIVMHNKPCKIRAPEIVSDEILIPKVNFELNAIPISTRKQPIKIRAKTNRRKHISKKINVTKPSKIPKPIKSKIVNKIQNKRGIITRTKLHGNYPNMTDKKEQNEEIRRIKNPKTRRKTTAIACIKCWKAKTRCGVKRPCNRCVRIGCQLECVDRPLSSRSRQNVKAAKIVKRKNIKNKIHQCDNIQENKLTTVRDLPPLISSQKFSTTPIQELPPVTTIATKIERPFLAQTSLSAIIGGFNKQSKSRKISISNRNESELPLRKKLNNTSQNDSFVYLPVLTQYQICQKLYCKLCYGIFDNYHKHSNELHLQTIHNYSCPNCDRQFVLQNHLSIHLKICKQSKQLSTNLANCKKINEMNRDEFEQCINFTIDSPIKNYYSTLCYEDVHPPKHWIEEQYKFKQLLSELLNKNNHKNEYIHVPLFKKLKKTHNHKNECMHQLI